MGDVLSPIIGLVLACAWPLQIAAQNPGVPLLPRDREVRLAMGAAPPHVSGPAAIYVLERSGYVRVRDGTNGFTCLVLGDHPEEVMPVCYDGEASRTVLLPLLSEAELRSQGRSEREVRAAINEELRTGRFRLPQLNLPDADAPVVPPVTADAVLDGLRAAAGGLPPLLPHDRELALAESAGPPALARRATIYVLRRGGFVPARLGSNRCACLVQRGAVPGPRYPVCFDPEGSQTLLPPILRTAALREQGRSQAAIESAIAAGFRRGEFRAPRRPGIAYMLSMEGRFPAANGGLTGWTPHFMIYAPYVRAEDIGAVEEEGVVRRLPTVVQDGPRSYIVFTARPNDKRASP
jgi:hypothetical protein